MAEQSVPDDLESLARAFGVPDVDVSDGVVEFECEAGLVIANVLEHSARVRVRLYLEFDDEAVVEKWVLAQPDLRSGLIEASELEGQTQPRLVFERPIGHDWADDQLVAEALLYRDAWRSGTRVNASDLPQTFRVADDPLDIRPESAWLLMGDSASLIDPLDLEDARLQAAVGIYDYHWTGASTTKKGDLVLIYFMAPHKEVRYIARAASDAQFRRDLDVNADKKVQSAQWWVTITPPTPIRPIPVTDLRASFGGNLPLRGKSGRFIPPEAIDALRFISDGGAPQSAIDRLATRPTGLASLPDPARMTSAEWSAIAAGALRLEADVSTYVVEPLLRLAVKGTSLTYRREVRVGRRFADYVVFDGERPVHVIEVKKRIRRDASLPWAECRDFTQVRWYAEHLGVSCTLVDAHQLALISAQASAPRALIERVNATSDDFALLKQFITGGGRERHDP
ncbi:hypothetical protein ACTHQ1_04220 [Janibacter anophelis]|uniref:hypothetical protein n=1 Tax=Janibacter anophelis TaxID=319054 RepID=UPI003F811020